MRLDAIVCLHGDLQPNNLLFSADDGDNVSDELAAILDWQLAFGGNPLVDLARFLVCGVDESVRLVVEEAAFELYYRESTRLRAEIGQTLAYSHEQVVVITTTTMNKKNRRLSDFVGARAF